jgi:hypothetical protein
MIEGAIYNPEGKVALRYYQPIPKQIQIGSEYYYFDCQHGVSMFFANEADVPALLNVIGGCCGGQKKVISLASESAYNVYKTGDR